MSSDIEASEASIDGGRAAPDQAWAAHRSALRMPELRSALEQLHARLEGFLKDAEQT
jgi:hypothetical protein